MNNANKRSIQTVNAETAADIIGNMNEDSRVDLGHSFVVCGKHPALGDITVFNSAEGDSAVVSN